MSGLLCCVISRGTTVLARYAQCAGNFNEICELVLAKIPPGDGKMSYSHGEFFYHYTSKNGIITLVISGKEPRRSKKQPMINIIFLFLK